MVPHQLPSVSGPAAPKLCQPWGPLLIGGAGYLGDGGDGDYSEGRLLCRDDDGCVEGAYNVGGGGGFGSVDDVTYFAVILCIWFIIFRDFAVSISHFKY